ncbi:hypothetical protein Ancab_015990 [Ancistrocladus abbreviatus]
MSMMQINYTLPPHNLDFFQTKHSSFQCRGWSPLKPTSRPFASMHAANDETIPSSTEKTKIHLSNLEKLLQKQQTGLNQPEVQPVLPKEENRGKGGILEGLNLSGIWPADIKSPTEDMSLNHLNGLQRLLSVSPEYSPRNHLGSRWREYHGSNDWAGLLDPLDENLRREVVRYGEFVQAAYHTFYSNPAASCQDLDPKNEVHLPDRSYKVTKSLYATSSVGLPRWVDDVAPDIGWMTQRSSCIGYVAVCDNSREIARMGRRDIVIALRGTATCLEWAENLRDLLVQMPSQEDPSDGQPKVECGFLSLFTTKGERIPSLAESVVQEIRRLTELYKDETLTVTITGHSLGAALALLVADELSACSSEVPSLAVFSFGGPRVGNRAFANRLNSKNVKILRIVNTQDVITRIPGMFVSEELDQKLRCANMSGVLDMLDNNMPWAYTHVGTELKVETKMSPYLKPNADVACCHDLEAYLHLVDGFLASNTPFRPNAKRNLLKLLSEQGANVKKLCGFRARFAAGDGLFDLVLLCVPVSFVFDVRGQMVGSLGCLGQVGRFCLGGRSADKDSLGIQGSPWLLFSRIILISLWAWALSLTCHLGIGPWAHWPIRWSLGSPTSSSSNVSRERRCHHSHKDLHFSWSSRQAEPSSGRPCSLQRVLYSHAIIPKLKFHKRTQTPSLKTQFSFSDCLIEGFKKKGDSICFIGGSSSSVDLHLRLQFKSVSRLLERCVIVVVVHVFQWKNPTAAEGCLIISCKPIEPTIFFSKFGQHNMLDDFVDVRKDEKQRLGFSVRGVGDYL